MNRYQVRVPPPKLLSVPTPTPMLTPTPTPALTSTPTPTPTPALTPTPQPARTAPLQMPNPRRVKNSTTKYTDEEIKEKLNGYFQVSPALWDHVPAGAHVRYFKKQEPGENLTRAERFVTGGFVHANPVQISVTGHKKDKAMQLGQKPPFGKDAGGKDAGGKKFPVRYDTIEELWKKYDFHAFVELVLIANSLTDMRQKIDELTSEVQTMKDKYNMLLQSL